VLICFLDIAVAYSQRLTIDIEFRLGLARLQFHSGSWGMTHYRVYPLDQSGHIAGPPEDLTCDNDATAIEQAKRLVDGRDVEVWDSGRLVIHLPKRTTDPTENISASKGSEFSRRPTSTTSAAS